MTQTKKRKGPQESATKFSVGTKKKGNDGNMWLIVADKNGTHRWKKLSGKTQKNRSTKHNQIKGKTYFTHDNGGRPFMVVINGKNVDIYTYPKDFSFEQKLEKNDYTVPVKSYKNVKKIFIGKSVKGDDAHRSFLLSSAATKFGLGNSILLQLHGNRYAFIGESVYEFETKHPIEQFYSMIGRSDVPYPVAIGEKNVYFLTGKGEYGYVSREHFEGFPKKYNWALQSYERLWAQNAFEPDVPDSVSWKQKLNKYGLKKFAKKIPKIKIIHKRP